MKKVFAAGAVLTVLLIAAVLIVPSFIDLGRFKRSYLPVIEETLRRRVDVGEVRLSLLPAPSIKVSNLEVSASPAAGAGNLFAAGEVQLRVKVWPLLRGRFEITEFILDKPVFHVHTQAEASGSDGRKKTKPEASRREIQKPPAGPKPQDGAMVSLAIPDRLRVKDGELNVVGADGKLLRIGGIGLSMQEFSNDKPFPYRASFDYPGLKTVSLEGRLDYREEEATLTLLENRLSVRNLTLPVEGNISHLSTLPRLDLFVADDHLDARPILEILSVFGLAPHDTEIFGPMALRMALTGPSNNLVTQIHGQFKEVTVEGKRALKGNLHGAVSLRLPLGGADFTRHLQGDGRLSALDGELTHADLINKLQRVAGLVGLSQDERSQVTSFKTLDTEFTLGNGLVDFKRIRLSSPQLEINGAGTMTLAQPALDIAVEATLSRPASKRAGTGKTAEFFKNSRGQLVVPLKVTGRLENPAVDVDGEKLTQRGATRSMEKSVTAFFKQIFRR